MRRKILVTGAAGYVASQLLPDLRVRYDLILLDTRTATAGGRPVPGVVIADLADPDLDQMRPHFQGVDTVLHLAYFRPSRRSWPDNDATNYQEERQNVDMAYAVYQLSHDAGCGG